MEYMTPKGGDKAFDEAVVIRMSGELKADLKALADQDDRKLAEYCRIVLRDHAAAKKKRK